MGRAAVIFFVVFICALIVAGAVLLYIYRDKIFGVSETRVETRNIFIRAMDIETKELLSINFTVIFNNSFYSKGTTNTAGYEEMAVPINGDVTILNDDNGYYSDFVHSVQSSATLELHKFGNLEISKNRELSNDYNSIELSLSTDSHYRQLGLCIAWSINILDVSIANASSSDVMLGEMEVPKRLKDSVFKCYKTDYSLVQGDTLNIALEYSKINPITEQDFIRVTFLDRNKIFLQYSPYKLYVVESEDGRDVGSKDVGYIIWT